MAPFNIQRSGIYIYNDQSQRGPLGVLIFRATVGATPEFTLYDLYYSNTIYLADNCTPELSAQSNITASFGSRGEGENYVITYLPYTLEGVA